MYTVKEIDNNQTDIQIVRGNTFREQVRISNDARLAYVPEVADEIIFLVYNKYTDEKPLFEKHIPYDTMVLQLSAKETSRMKYGNYVYKIRLIRRNGDIDDFVHGNFQIKEVL